MTTSVRMGRPPEWGDTEFRDIEARLAAGQLFPEIAEAYGLNVSTVYQRWYRHRKTMARIGEVESENIQDFSVGDLGFGHHVVQAGDPPRPDTALQNLLATWSEGDIERPLTVGVMADERPDPAEVWERAESIWQKTAEKLARQKRQEIVFGQGPACLVFMSDLHLGSAGTNYPKIKAECELALQIPNCGVFLVGDLIDNFILGWCMSIRDHTRLSIPDEWVLAEHVLDLLGPKLVACVAGNHDNWTVKAAGVDLLRDLVGRIRKGVIYDSDDALIKVSVGDASWRIRARHKFKGSSIYNAIHGQGRAARWDGDADIYVGAHTHPGALYGTLNIGERRILGAQLGAYKAVDEYARREGFSQPSGDAAFALILTERGRWVPCDSLDEAHRVMTGRL